MSPKKPAVYSYHTFIFPFLWNDGGKVSRKEFEKCLNMQLWKIDLFGKYREDEPAVRSEYYSAYQYFNNAARAVIYTFEDNEKQSVRCYRYMPDLFKNKAHNIMYNIRKENQEFTLSVNGIRLKLYNTGIGLLIYELENQKYPLIDDINKINDLGRRICRPFYVPDSFKCSLCADNISISGIADIQGKNICSKLSGAPAPEEPTKTELARIITFLLEDDDYKVTINKSEKKKNEFFIEPIIDDRMFVACYINNKELTDLLAQRNKDGEYRYLSDAEEKSPDDKYYNVSRKLYETIFVDGDGLSCHSRETLKRMLSESIYDRWIEYRYDGEPSGTVYGISEYSIICISASLFSANAFLTEYIELAMLVLAQRASLLAFERRISEVSSSKKGEKELQEQYIDFDSQYMLHEVTAQQQGIEIFNIILEKMFIKSEKTDIENQIHNLFELKNFKNDRWMNGILFGLAVLGTIEIVSIILDWIIK